jgi:hypothetical protein
MKAVLLGTALGVGLFSGMAVAEAVETLDPKCQKYAHEFSENPDALNETQLKQLQFCITRTLEQRYRTNPPELLKGTIIEPPSSSIEIPGTTPSAPLQNPGVKQ